MKPKPSEILRALADGKIVDYEAWSGGIAQCKLVDEEFYWKGAQDEWMPISRIGDEFFVVYNATRIIEPEHWGSKKIPDGAESLDEISQKHFGVPFWPKEPEQDIAAQIFSHGVSMDIVNENPREARYQEKLKIREFEEKWLAEERQKAKDELLKEIAIRVCHHEAITIPFCLDIDGIKKLKELTDKAFPEES